MSQFYKFLNIPAVQKIGRGFLQKLPEVLKEFHLYFEHPFFVSGTTETRQVAAIAQSSFRHFSYIQIKENSISEIERVEKEIDVSSPDVIVAVGGGKVIDTAKFVSMRAYIPFLSIPTSLSNDGIASPIAVIKFRKRVKSIGTVMPTGILIDLDIVEKARYSTILSGIGDLLSNISAINDWYISSKNTNEHFDEYAASLSILSSESFFLNSMKRGKISIELLARGLMMSGIAMAIAHTSRPCSGAEHLISHAIDRLYPFKSLHGLQVGIATPFVLYLQNDERYMEILEFYKGISFPLSPEKIGLSKKEFLEAVYLAPEIRANRYTILNRTKRDSIIEAFNNVYQ